MRTLILTAVAATALLLGSVSAQAASITGISADANTYTVGQTITLTITGTVAPTDAAQAVFGQILFDGSKVSGQLAGNTQTPITSIGGGLPWTMGDLNTGVLANSMVVWDAFTAGSFTIDQGVLTTTLLLTADALGAVDFTWDPATNFFGLNGGPGESILIVPEPTTAALLGMGLLGLAVAGRRR